MDRFSFQEAILADYISVVSTYTKDQLLNELLDLKYNQLNSFSDKELTKELYEQKQKQKC